MEYYQNLIVFSKKINIIKKNKVNKNRMSRLFNNKKRFSKNHLFVKDTPFFHIKNIFNELNILTDQNLLNF